MLKKYFCIADNNKLEPDGKLEKISFFFMKILENVFVSLDFLLKIWVLMITWFCIMDFIQVRCSYVENQFDLV